MNTTAPFQVGQVVTHRHLRMYGRTEPVLRVEYVERLPGENAGNRWRVSVAGLCDNAEEFQLAASRS